MLSFYNFVFQRLTWKKIRVPYGLIIYFSRNEKLQKYRIILSKHTNYLHKWLVPFLTFLLLPCFFSSTRFLNMCKPRTGWPTWIDILWSGLACLPSWLGMMNTSWFSFTCSFFSEFSFHCCNIFFSSFDYLFELIFGSYTASRVLNIWRLKYKSI